MKGNSLTGKRKIVAVVSSLCVGSCLSVVPLASAYVVPGPPGTPGGKPTASTGGSSQSQNQTQTAATALAGYTGLELSKLSPKVTLPSNEGASAMAIPAIGADSATRTGSHAKVSCSVHVAKSEIGSGSARMGAKSFRIHFTISGRRYLRNHNGTAISLAVKCTFAPKQGKKSSSTSKVVLAA